MPPWVSQLTRVPRWACLRCRRIPPIRRLHQLELPPNAPKTTINLKAIRADPDYHVQNCINKNYAALSTVPTRIIGLHDELVSMQKSLRSERERANSISAQVRSASKEEKPDLLAEAKKLKSKISSVEVKEAELEKEMKILGESLPNIAHPLTPVGESPKLIGYINEDLVPSHNPTKEKMSHIQIGAELKLLDFSDAGTVSGWGWYYLLNEAVLLEQALVNYALTLARSHGFRMVAPPSIVYSHIAGACGFRPRDQNGEQQIYAINDGKHSLTGTAEIPLAGMHANKTFSAEDMPIKVVGVGRAYRAEAGARGMESKGLYRVHEFTKVELFAWASPPNADTPIPDTHHDVSSASTYPTTRLTEPSSADTIFDSMLALQIEFLKSLGLHCRILEMSTTDLGASAARKIDIEAYIPSRAAKDPWGEVSSLSNCTDYQSRRLNTRVKALSAKTTFPYTLNGTAVAVPRVLIAILENGWDEARQGVVVPEVLRPFMGGMDLIVRNGKKLSGRYEDC